MYLLFDIGGTKMRLSSFFVGKKLNEVRVIGTPVAFQEGLLLFKRLANELRGGKAIKGIVGGIAGPLNIDKSRVGRAAHLPGWVNKPLKSELVKLTSGPVFLENDTALAGLGETFFGAGRGYNIIMYYTVSTGVGGVRIVNGKIDYHTIGFEPGHQVIGYANSGSTQLKYLESFVSGAGLARRYQKDPAQIFERQVWEDSTRWLACGLHNSIVHWSPEVVVIGGGLINHKAILLSNIRQQLKQIMTIFPKIPPIKKAQLGDKGGLYGAMVLLKQNL